jgi:cell division protein FtsB
LGLAQAVYEKILSNLALAALTAFRYLTTMRFSVSMIVLLFALIAATILVVSDDGFARLASLQRSLDNQRRANSRLDSEVQSLRREVHGLQNDPRVIEKAARGELGMARPDELVVVFEKKETDKKEMERAQGK